MQGPLWTKISEWHDAQIQDKENSWLNKGQRGRLTAVDRLYLNHILHILS